MKSHLFKFHHCYPIGLRVSSIVWLSRWLILHMHIYMLLHRSQGKRLDWIQGYVIKSNQTQIADVPKLRLYPL